MRQTRQQLDQATGRRACQTQTTVLLLRQKQPSAGRENHTAPAIIACVNMRHPVRFGGPPRAGRDAGLLPGRYPIQRRRPEPGRTAQDGRPGRFAKFTADTAPVGDVHRIEILRGPGGTLWGAMALDGVSDTITRKPCEMRRPTPGCASCWSPAAQPGWRNSKRSRPLESTTGCCVVYPCASPHARRASPSGCPGCRRGMCTGCAPARTTQPAGRPIPAGRSRGCRKPGASCPYPPPSDTTRMT